MEAKKLSLNELLEVFWVRIISPKDEAFEDTLSVNEFEKTGTGQLFSIEEQDSNDNEVFSNASGDCFYVDTLEEVLEAFNEKLESGHYDVEATEDAE